MKRRAKVFWAVVLGVGASASAGEGARAACPSSPPASSGSVGTMTLVGQVNSASCWAATGQMITTKLGLSCSQCRQLSAKCGLCGTASPGCCSTSATTSCVQGGFVDWAFCGFSATRTADGTALTWSALRNEIACQQKPVAFSWRWAGSATAGGPGGGGHMMVAAKYRDGATTGKQVYVYDPDPVGSGESFWMAYSVYVEGRYHRHWSDDYQIRRRP